MKFKNRYVTWTVLELSGLLEEEDARVYFERTKKHLALHPFYLTNLQKALNENLSSMLNTYDTELKGFVLAYKNPKLLTSLGETYYDSCFIHVDIEADFYLFRPKVGCSLKGIVNNKGLDHIVMLIHKIFTISIPKPDNTEQWAGDLVDIGQEVRCCVTQIDRNIKLPFISATLNSDYLQGCRLFESMHNINNIGTAIENNNVDSNNEINDKSNIAISEENASISDRERKKNRKKHMKKSRESDSDTAFKHENNAASVNNSGDDSSTCIKYEEEKQRKSIKREHSTLNTDHTLNVIELDSVSKKRKKNKTSKDVSLDSDSESRAVKIKVEKSDSQKSESTKMGNQSSFNSDNRNTNMDLNVESHKGVKREHSTDSISEPEKKKKKKRAKKSDSESVSATENEEKIIDNTVSAFPCDIKQEDEQYEETQSRNRKYSESDADLSPSKLNSNSVSKKHKKTKKMCMVMSNSESEDKIKVEKPDLVIDKIIAENHVPSSKNKGTQNISKNIEMHEHVKTEDISIYDTTSEKEKKSSKKHMKKSNDTDSEPVFRMKNEDKKINVANISRTIKQDDEEQAEDIKYSVSNTNISLNNSDLDQNVSKKCKKSKKSSKVSDSESEHHVKIKVEKD